MAKQQTHEYAFVDTAQHDWRDQIHWRAKEGYHVLLTTRAEGDRKGAWIIMERARKENDAD